MSLVGEFDPIYLKLFDFTRSSIRSAFDGNVVYQFETMESVSVPFALHHLLHSFVSDIAGCLFGVRRLTISCMQILDYAFDRMGCDAAGVNAPIVFFQFFHNLTFAFCCVFIVFPGIFGN